MPRGLGEDPLARQRKGHGRATPQATPISNPADASSHPHSGHRGVEASSSRPTSYNDVFFKKRSYDVPAVAASEPPEIVPAQSVSASAAAQPTVEAPAAIESAAAAPQVDSQSGAPPLPLERSPAVDVPAAPQEPIATEPQPGVITSAPPPVTESRPAPEAPQKGGILKRLFRRFGK